MDEHGRYATIFFSKFSNKANFAISHNFKAIRKVARKTCKR